MSLPKPGDYVLYKLSSSGVEGTCLLTEEGTSHENGTQMFLGHEETQEGLRVVHLYPSDILDVLITSDAECWACGHTWTALRPDEAKVLECPACGEMMGAS